MSKEGGAEAFWGGGADKAGAASATKPSKSSDVEMARRRRFMESSLTKGRRVLLESNVGIADGEGKRKFCEECIEDFCGAGAREEWAGNPGTLKG